MPRHLGKQSAAFNPNLKLAKFFKLLAPAPLHDISWSPFVSNIPMLGNDVAGDCGIATSLHFLQFISAANGELLIPDTSSAIADYSQLTGYNPATKANDNGVILDTKNAYWMKTGFAVKAGGSLNRLDGYGQIEAGDINSLIRSLDTFGPVELGLQLPSDAEDQYDQSRTWDSLACAPGSLGGHDTLLVDCMQQGEYFRIATWDGYVVATRAWITKYMDEGTALLSRDWIAAGSHISPTNYTMEALDQLLLEQHGTVGP
jgi:hypothetical protein